MSFDRSNAARAARRARRLAAMTVGSAEDPPEPPATPAERWALANELLAFGLGLQGVEYPRYHGKEGRMGWPAHRFRPDET